MNQIISFEEQKKELEVMKSMAAIAMKSGKYSGDYNEGTIINIFYTAKAFKIDPFYALNGAIQIVKGKINMSAHLMSAMARRAGHSIKVIQMDDKSCTIIAKRKDNDDSLKYEMTLDEASRAGLIHKDNWKNHPKQMLYCACLRNVFRILFSDIAIPYDADEMNVEDTSPQTEDLGCANSAPAVVEVQEPKKIDPRPKEVVPVESVEMTPFEQLREHLEIDNIPSDRLEEWIEMRCAMKDQIPDKIIGMCLENQKNLEGFKKIFTTWLRVATAAVAV